MDERRLKTYINEKLSVENLDSIGIFNSEEVRKMLKLHIGGSKNFGEQLFMVLVCQEWAVKWAVKK
jgi:hypothetical protein